jgi:dTDP-4-dehydrorhamnose reductase
MSGIRIAVTGTQGQVVKSLMERAPAPAAEIVAIGRPVLDLSDPATVEPAITAARPALIVNAAAVTDSEQAELEPDVANAVNADGAAALAICARKLGIPIIHLSTDYVFDGSKPTPYVETDAVAPLSAYGRSKVAGERAVAAAQPEHAILRVAWVYSPFGRNFVTTMLKLAAGQSEVRVVDDQVGNPTSAADIADGILTVAHNLTGKVSAERYGLFHMTGAGAASRADFAEAIFSFSREAGGPMARVVRIKTEEYPTRVRRPANSQLDCSKIAAVHGVTLPPWRSSLRQCVERIVERRA